MQGDEITLEGLSINSPSITSEERAEESFVGDTESLSSTDESSMTHSELCSEDLDTSELDTSNATSASVDTSYYILDWRSDLTPGAVREEHFTVDFGINMVYQCFYSIF